MSNVSAGEQQQARQSKTIATRMQELKTSEQDIKVSREKRATKSEYLCHIEKMSDSVSLGSTSWKEDTDYKRKRNSDIRAAKALTKNATAYTLEIKNKIDDIDATDFSRVPVKDLMMRLESVAFTPEMFFSEVILKNFTEYMILVRSYDALNDRWAEVDSERLNRIADIMNPFKDRMREFCEANGLDLNGSELPAKAKPYTLGKSAREAWFDTVNNYESAREDDYHPDDDGHTAEEITYLLDQLDAVHAAGKQEDDDEDEEASRARTVSTTSSTVKQAEDDAAQPADPLSCDTAFKRIANLSGLKAAYELCRSHRQQAETERFADKTSHTADEIRYLKRMETEAKAIFILAEKEALYNKARLEHDPQSDELLESVYETREDLRRLQARYVKEELKANEKTCRQTRSVQKITRLEAISTESDAKSYESRMALAKIINDIPKSAYFSGSKKQQQQFSKVLHKVMDYVNNTRYKVGYTAETGYLKDAIKAVEEFSASRQSDAAHVAEANKIKAYFDRMTNGTLQVAQGKNVDMRGLVPEEGVKTHAGYRRNSFLRFFTHWTSRKDTPLFSHEPTVNDLKQRMVSNCYMVSAIGTLCELDPGFIKSMMKDNGDGTVTVRLYRDWEPLSDDIEERRDEEKERTLEKDKLYAIRNRAGARYGQNNDHHFENSDTVQKRSFLHGTSTVITYNHNDREKRRDQIISAFHRIQEDLESRSDHEFTVTGLDERTREFLFTAAGSNSTTYKAATGLIEKFAARIPAMQEYIEHGTVGGEAVSDYKDLGQKLWNRFIEYYKSDGGEDLEAFFRENIRDIQIEGSDLQPVYVRVDKTVPRIASTDMLSAGALWMQMIEKACAFMSVGGKDNPGSGYSALWYGDGHVALKAFAGSTNKKYELTGDTDELFEKICNWREDRTVYTTGTKDEGVKGLQSGHAYSILGGYRKHGQRFVRLRNPYSQGSSAYDYGKDEEAASRTQILNFMGGSDESYGMFDLKWEDFKANFKEVFGCKVGVPA